MAVFSRSLDTTIWNKTGLRYDKEFLGGTDHHDPDEEECVADEKEKNRNLTNIEVNSISLKERTILNNIIRTTWMINYNPQHNPYCHVDDWASCQEEVLDDNTSNTNTSLTTSKHDEVFVLYGYKGEGELDLEEQV